MARRSILLFACVVCACRSGDERRESPTAEPAAPADAAKARLGVTWSGESFELVDAGRIVGRGGAAIADGFYQVTVHGLPSGTRWRCGDASGTFDRDEDQVLPVRDLIEVLGDVPLGDDVKVDPHATLILETPTQHGEVQLRPAPVGYAVEEVLGRAAAGPVVFGDEPADAHPWDSALFIEGAYKKIIGPAKLVRDVDALVVLKLQPDVKGEKPCRGYSDERGLPLPDVTLRLRETWVTIYDRRAGKPAVSRIFPPDSACPRALTVPSGVTAIDSAPPDDAIEAWVGEQLRP